MNYMKEIFLKKYKKSTKTKDDFAMNIEENSRRSLSVFSRSNSSETRSDKRSEESRYDFLKRATSAQVFAYLKDNKLPYENREISPTREQRLQNLRQATSAEVYARLKKGFRPKNENNF